LVSAIRKRRRYRFAAFFVGAMVSGALVVIRAPYTPSQPAVAAFGVLEIIGSLLRGSLVAAPFCVFTLWMFRSALLRVKGHGMSAFSLGHPGGELTTFVFFGFGYATGLLVGALVGYSGLFVSAVESVAFMTGAWIAVAIAGGLMDRAIRLALQRST
jgi:hypothetical protein